MSREPVRGVAEVRLGGRPVGLLEFQRGGSTFRYTDDLLDPRHPVLGQVFEERPRARHRSSVGLPHWFANLLPEIGSGLRRYYMAQWGDRHLDDARLLLALGEDLPGAVTVSPVDIPERGLLTAPAVAEVGQLKMSVIRSGERLTLPARGDTGGLIAKLPERAFENLCENEYLMMRWAAAAGLEVPAVELVTAARIPPIFEAVVEPSAPAYVVTRFDRGTGGVRIHIEDLAQVADVPPALRDRGATYDSIAATLNELTGGADLVEYIRRLVAMVLMGNTDAHLKNWSLIYRDGHTPRLSPAYDLVSSTVYRRLALSTLTFSLGGEKLPDQVDLDCFRRLAVAAGVAEETIVDTATSAAEAMAQAWPEVRRADGGLFPALAEHIDRRLAKHPLLP
jgi:serine/threonine-protein kinase HipA